MTGDLAASGRRHVYGSVSVPSYDWGLVETMPVIPADPAAFFEGFCPNCHVPLGGDVRNWCPQCKAYWNARATP